MMSNSFQEAPQYRKSQSDKISFLKRTDSYPENPDQVELKETHMSWLFMTDNFVYKMKKPVKTEFLDFSSPEKRYKNCTEELRLNRRISPEIYSGIVSLGKDSNGNLHLNSGNEKVDWLLKMKRLPEETMLIHQMNNNRMDGNLLEKAAKKISEFYIRSGPVRISEKEYLQRLRNDIEREYSGLINEELRLDRNRIEHIYSGLIDFMQQKKQLITSRYHKEKVIEGHGDLRPEHLFLISDPVFIDCLEFNRDFRILDIAEELSFFAMECELNGSAVPGKIFIQVYEELSHDQIDKKIISFFKCKRAFLRAKLAIWHTLEDEYKDDPKWKKETENYLSYAEKCSLNLL